MKIKRLPLYCSEPTGLLKNIITKIVDTANRSELILCLSTFADDDFDSAVRY
jgi:hypothetical protein